MKRKSISKKLRFEIFKRDSFTCQFCGKSSPSVILEIDHILPVSKGGDNDILNLITTCFDCNRGKKNTLLPDQNVLEKQISQLKELNQKREQLELLVKWKKELRLLSQKSLEHAIEIWEEKTPGYHLNHTGIQRLEKLLHKHGISDLIDAIQTSQIHHLKYDENGEIVKDSLEKAFDQISFFLKFKQEKEYLRDFYYIRGILKNRLTYFSGRKLSVSIDIMKNAYEHGIDVDDIKRLATQVSSWSEFEDTLHLWIGEEK